jgi:hypothetical protein
MRKEINRQPEIRGKILFARQRFERVKFSAALSRSLFSRSAIRVRWNADG